MISSEDTHFAIHKAWAVGLYGEDWLRSLTPGRVSAACNGCGPEWMSQEMRDKLTAFLAVFFPAFCLHDCRFAYDNDGTRAKFDAANRELRLNCRILADDAYGWYDPRRYVWRHRAKLVYLACKDFGWSAWRDAYGENQKQKQGENK